MKRKTSGWGEHQQASDEVIIQVGCQPGCYKPRWSLPHETPLPAKSEPACEHSGDGNEKAFNHQ